MKAIIVGSSGLTGGTLLEWLLQQEFYDEVITLSRKRSNHLPSSPKHTDVILDLWDEQALNEYMKGDHLFICTGTTQAKTPNKEEYFKIEHDLPLLLSKVAYNNNVKKVLVVSALGAHRESKFFYNRGKGLMEQDIEALGGDCYFVQPALIGGNRDEKRPFERTWKKVQAVIDPLLVGPLKKYRTIHPLEIAKSMVYLAHYGYDQRRVESPTLKLLAKQIDDVRDRT